MTTEEVMRQIALLNRVVYPHTNYVAPALEHGALVEKTSHALADYIGTMIVLIDNGLTPELYDEIFEDVVLRVGRAAQRKTKEKMDESNN